MVAEDSIISWAKWSVRLLKTQNFNGLLDSRKKGQIMGTSLHTVHWWIEGDVLPLFFDFLKIFSPVVIVTMHEHTTKWKNEPTNQLGKSQAMQTQMPVSRLEGKVEIQRKCRTNPILT